MSRFILALPFLLGCGLVADVPRDAGADHVEEMPPCAPLTDTGVAVTTQFVAGAPPALAARDSASDLGLYSMKERVIYSTGASGDPSDTARKTLELLPSGFVAVVRVDGKNGEHRVRYASDTGKLESGAHLFTVCGETETWTFEVVPLTQTRLALVGRRGARTVIEYYEPPPPL